MRFAYKNRGASLLHWDGRTAPSQTRAGETRSLGSLELDIPRPGAPEVVSGLGSLGGAAMQRYRRRGIASGGGPRLSASTSISCCENCSCGGGDPCCSDMAMATSRSRSLSGYIPEGAARSFGNTLMGESAPAPVDTSGMIRKVAVLASAYHGVKRNNGSIFWGLAWAAAAYVTPLNGAIVPALGVAQGFGKPK